MSSTESIAHYPAPPDDQDQNPRSVAILRPRDVYPGVRFITWDTQGQPRLPRMGRFTSSAYYNSDHDLVADVVWDGGRAEGEVPLSGIGIARNRGTGEFNSWATIYYGEDGP